MSLNYFENNDEQVYKQISKEFNKTKEDLNEDINILRRWADTQLHFPEKPSDRILRFVILFNKFSIEKAKQRLDMYYTIRSLIPEFYNYQPLSPEQVLQGKIVYCVPLPKPTHDFKRIIYSQMNPNFGPEYFDHEKLFEYCINLLELIIQEDNCYCFHYIFDSIGMKLGHIPKFSPMVLRKAAIALEKVYSNRVASFYMVNFHPFMESFLNTVVKPMINPKIRDRIRVYSGSDILLEVFGKSVMPKDIGGEERSLEELSDMIQERFEANKDRFEVLQTLKVNESLRPNKLVNDDVLGYYGNFKKINID